MTDREEALIILQNCLDYENGKKCIYPIFPIERYGEALKTAIESLKSRPHGEWIPISVGVPEKDGRYLALFKDHGGTIMCADYLGGRWYPDDYECTSDCVLAWMPLPEPYKGEGDEK